MTTATEQATVSARKARKTRIGIVVSDRMDKTIAVAIERYVRHPLYKKYFKKTKKLLAHDEESTAHIGDKVMIMETRPLSKKKCWRLAKVIERAK
jgi:small subunit ribosomal protein S17